MMGKPSIRFLLSAFSRIGAGIAKLMGKGRERMKKWKLLVGLTLLLLLLLSVTAQADSTSYGVVFGAANVNLRSAPSTSATVMGAYDKGTWMTVRGYSNGFYQVETPDGRYGWMRQDYLLVSADATGTIGYVSHAGYLNLRREASTSAKVLGKYDDGTPCVILDRMGDWYYVSVGGQTGYFLTRFISTRSGVYSDKLGMVISPNKEAVYLRTGPGKNYSRITSVTGCTYVMILQQGNGWWKVAVNGRVGFMSTDYLRAGHIRLSEGEALCAKAAGNTSGSSSSSSTSQQATYAVVNNPNPSDKLNLRSKASTRGTSLGKYSNGTVVTMISQGDQWCKVKTPDGKTGYMMTDYLSIPTSGSSSSTRIVRHPQGTYVNLRSSGTKSARVLVQVPHGATVVVLSEGKTWTKVRYNGYTGYMMTTYLKKQ